MSDYAAAGYRLQAYKITFYADRNGKQPLKTVRRAFPSYDCAKMWEADVMSRHSEYKSVTIDQIQQTHGMLGRRERSEDDLT